MDFLKRLCVYIGVILLCISIYKDIAEGTLPSQHEEPNRQQDTNDSEASIIKVKVKPGDTVLSITEQINKFKNYKMDIQKILDDFKQYNPNINPNHLNVNEYYYFLNYDNV